MIRDLPIDQINVRADARAVDEATVTGLVDSIGTVGLINPIRVRASDNGQWEVVAGVHRLTACKRLGLVEITALVGTDDDIHAELAMIDENLCRAELSPADRAQQTFRRKEIYEKLNPSSKPEFVRAQAANIAMGHDVDDNLTPTFTQDTAHKTGQDIRRIQRDVDRGKHVIPEVIDMIRGTKLDTGSYLDKIKRLRPNEQVAAVRRDLAHLRQQEREKQSGLARRIVKVDEPLTDEEASDKQFAALVAAWNKAGESARQRFREEIVDAPVFDRSAA